MAGRELVEVGKKGLDLLYELEKSPQSETPNIVKDWNYLHFNDAHIDSLPESIDRCIHARVIETACNRLSCLPQSIFNMPQLTKLDLSLNAFNSFPIVLSGMTKLQSLNLSYNHLSELPMQISGMTGLKDFNIGFNNFTTFPTALFNMSKLETLTITGNMLSNIPVEIKDMTGLRKFFLFCNCFTMFPIALCGMGSLKELYLGNLKGLYVHHNHISYIPADIVSMTGLESLDLESNNVTHLPPQIRNMKSLVELNVRGNPLVQPPEHIVDRGLDAIKRYFEALTTTGAILSSRIQVNLLGETVAGKTSLSRTLQRGTSTLTILADRTRVVEQMTWNSHQDIVFNINDFGGHDVYKIGHPIFISKHGLVLITFDLLKYDPGNKKHYQFYIGNWIEKVQAKVPGVKMAVVGTHVDKVEDLDSKCDKVEKQLRDHKQKQQDWCKSQIKKIEGNTDGTQTSIPPAYADKISKLMALKEQVKNIPDSIFWVSSKTMKGIKELQDFLVTVAKDHAVQLPKMWVEAASNICNKKYDDSPCNTLELDEVQKLIKQYAPASWSQEVETYNKKVHLATNDILNFLADCGDIIWFDSSPSLKKVVFHKQEVLVNVLKAVLNHDKADVLSKLLKPMNMPRLEAEDTQDKIFNRGIISKKAMELLCEPLCLSSTEVTSMEKLMQKLELCYQVQEEQSFHFPCLLTQERQSELDEKWPSKVSSDTTQLALEIHFPFQCPEGIYEKLSVRLHNFLEHTLTEHIDWKDGVYAQLQSCQMQLSREERHQQREMANSTTDWVITIAIRGSDLLEMWPVLSRAHDYLMAIIEEDWPGVSYGKYLVCPHCTSEDREEPTRFKKEILEGVNRPTNVLCKNTGRYISADLVYPPHWKQVVNKNKDVLRQKITEPDLHYLNNLFFQEGIFSDYEYEWIKESPEKTAVFLDFLTTKSDKAFDILCQFFVEPERYKLLELIKY
ncbi:malignant fibrous histiocytoma-amplified sequence 1-like [Lingula anatina]|uniref:Malignant fibrous histiocytoma-amplified sequence 1-like n=1 Tax=Lingula anatina TaxID=7574 RepID=A0A1S3JPZ5_LINAN|nr:malignant fibrous histiocytoma-amplified sequence 1-like [Lingula anatina]|eukprot:XP_013412427.1 malignant fibrous histiocytoma-amplified sequence 1-like [Lingula anatina]